MTKQLQATLAAILVMSAMSVRAQLSTSTTTSKFSPHTTSPHTTRTTLVTTDRSASQSGSNSTAKSKKRSTAPKSTTRKSTSRKAPVESSTARELRELRDEMVNQQAQIDALKQQNSDKDAKLATAASDAQAANASAAAATAQAQSLQTLIQANSSSVQTLSSDVSDLKVANTGLATTLSEAKRDLNEKIESPTTLHYKGVTITPVAFFAAESVYRTRSTDSDIATPFSATPYSGAAQAHTSEWNGTGRQSRLGGLFTGNTGPFKLSGYFEADFLSAGITSNENQSNSYTFRQRQAWAQIATTSGFTMTGGQMWSLVTENKTGADNRTEVLPNTVDPNYHVGFSWTRQYGIRFQQKFTPAFTLAMSIEEAQNLFSASNAPTNFFIGSAGTGAGQFNSTANYSNNVSPDIIVKAAFDPKYGHFEVGGLGRFFRDRYYPGLLSVPPSGAAGAKNDTKFGGGALANARFPVTHFLDLGLHGLVGDGVGRYGAANLPDTTIHPDGTLALIHGAQALFSLETHPTKKLDAYGYFGGEYAQRTLYRNAAGLLVGYAPTTSVNTGCNTETVPTANSGFAPGAAQNCAGVTRAILQGTAGFTYRLASSPKYGRLQYQMVYSYLTREAWTGVGGAPKVTNNMVFTGMRYYIP